jgi:hypothetical protein
MSDILQMLGVAAAVVALVVVTRWRRRSHQAYLEEFAEHEVCEHLRRPLEVLRERGHRIVRAGQHDPQLPLEIHMVPAFDPQALSEELKLQEPVFVSERKVLYCREDACEIHPGG